MCATAAPRTAPVHAARPASTPPHGHTLCATAAHPGSPQSTPHAPASPVAHKVRSYNSPVRNPPQPAVIPAQAGIQQRSHPPSPHPNERPARSADPTAPPGQCGVTRRVQTEKSARTRHSMPTKHRYPTTPHDRPHSTLDAQPSVTDLPRIARSPTRLLQRHAVRRKVPAGIGVRSANSPWPPFLRASQGAFPAHQRGGVPCLG